MIIPCNTRSFRWTEADGSRGSFQPKGPIELHGNEDLFSNPVRKSSRSPNWSARLFVGFNVGGVPTWTIEDVTPVVFRVLESQGSPDASFLLQKGLYKSERTGEGFVSFGLPFRLALLARALSRIVDGLLAGDAEAVPTPTNPFQETGLGTHATSGAPVDVPSREHVAERAL